jgi:NAD(P)-dependent dehydrogenase (short-subunit alcohol dehydrogenase family)
MANKSKVGGKSSNKRARPRQKQRERPGVQSAMDPEPVSILPGVPGSGRLAGKTAIITGGDSGIGRAVALHFAREGANVAIVFLEESVDAEVTQQGVREHGTECLLLRGDLGSEAFCRRAVEKTIKQYGRLDVLVNNAAEQHPQKSILDIDEKQLLATFRTNIMAMFFLSKAALPYLQKQPGASIINTTSVTAYRGHETLLDYSATKGAIVTFTRSLSQALAKDGIRVNAVAPGPIWTPLIPSTFPEEKVSRFGSDTPMGRAGQPWECATCFVFLASQEASYITGQVLHPNGGEIING